MKSNDNTTTAQTTNDSPADDVAALAETIASQLTTTTDAPPHPDSDDIQMAALAAQPHPNDTTTSTKPLVTAAQKTGLFDTPIVAAIDVTRIEETSVTHSRVDEDTAYVTLSAVGTDAALILAGTTVGTDDPVAPIVDDLLAHVREAVTINHVVAGKACHTVDVLDLFNQHDLTYTVQKPVRRSDWQIIHDLIDRDDTTAALSNTTKTTTEADHDAITLYAPLPTTTSTQPDETDDDGVPDRYRVFVTNRDVAPADITDVLEDFLTRWIPIEVQQAVVRNVIATPQIGTTWGAVPPLVAATAEYNLWQLTRHVATQHDGDEAAFSLEDIQHLLDVHLQQQ